MTNETREASRRRWRRGLGWRAGLAVGAAVVALMVGAASVTGTALAAPGDATDAQRSDRAQRPQPEVVAIAIGTLLEDDGGQSWLSLRAGSAGDRVGGNFRFFCDEAGYYNGAVRSLTVEGGAIHAEGGGGLWRPDGTRIGVRFTLDISPDGATEVSVVGRDYEYTMTGTLDGFIFGGSPPARPAVD